MRQISSVPCCSSVQKERAAEALSLTGVKRKGGECSSSAEKKGLNITINMTNSSCQNMNIFKDGEADDRP